MRLATLVLLLVSPALGGCLDGDDERLAQPTDRPIVVPATRPTPSPVAVFNTSDPGYVVDAPWRIGDGWDYESDRSNIRRLRVLDQRLVGDTTKFLVETTQVGAGGSVESVTRAWVEPRGWLLLNETDERGVVDEYRPGMPLRFWRNASATFQHTQLDAGGREVRNESITLFSRLFPRHETLLFPWGYVEAKRVEHVVATTPAGGQRTEATVVHWVHRDYLGDVQFRLPDGETYKLTAARAGDFRRGQLA